MVALLLLGGAGCERPQIEEYTVKRIPSASNAGGGDGEAVRLLGAIFPRAGGSWFFKLVEPVDDVKTVEDEVNRFLRSVRFEGNEPPKYQPPDTWKPDKAAQLTYAAFRLGPEGRLKLTVSEAGGTLKENVDRWRKQIGLGELTEQELDKESREIAVGGAKGILVDFTGTRRASGGMPPFAERRRPSAPRSEGPGTKPGFTVPPAWKEAALRTFSVATFQVTDAGQTAEITVTPLSGAAGGLLSNVNRWRDQIGLPPTNEDQLAKDSKPITIDGQAGQMIDMKGNRERTLCAVVARGGQSWFFKMKGEAALVGKQQAAFEAFVKSVRFEGAGHE